jgi:hypothetical protein
MAKEGLDAEHGGCLSAAPMITAFFFPLFPASVSNAAQVLVTGMRRSATIPVPPNLSAFAWRYGGTSAPYAQDLVDLSGIVNPIGRDLFNRRLNLVQTFRQELPLARGVRGHSARHALPTRLLHPKRM